jgi:UDP-glucuronate decarboxylase
MRILVTGGAGFLGSHLVDWLLFNNHQVYSLDDLSTGGYKPSHPNFTGIVADVRSLPAKFGRPGDFDQIYHLACPASPVAYQQSPLRTVDIAYSGTRAVLELAGFIKARLVIASTSEVYGQPLQHPQRETLWSHTNPFGPRACYDIGKAAAEVLALSYARERDLDVRIARIHNTYGPRMSPTDGRVVSNFLIQALNGQPLTVYGNGLQTRCFCYVTDMIQGLVSLMRAEHLPDPPVINIGSDEEHCITYLAGLINVITGNAEPHNELPLPQDDPIQRKPDLTLAREYLNWNPVTNLRDGLIRTAEHFKS